MGRILLCPSRIESLGGKARLLKETEHKTRISMVELKKHASEKLPREWPLREILLSEPDELSTSVFLARLPLYLRLCAVKRSQ
jgi:hypothetical protein